MREHSIEERKFANFIFPDVEKEVGEIERVAAYVGEDKEQFTQRFLAAAQASSLVELYPQMWAELKNTDSFDVHFDGWSEIAEHIAADPNTRNWESLRRKMEQNLRMDAPIVVKLPNELHLVSGNTRLMVAKALGKLPRVLLVDLTASARS